MPVVKKRSNPLTIAKKEVPLQAKFMNIVLSIVIVEFHSLNETKKCVAALKSHIGVPYEIIVSSNSCYDEKQKEQIDFSDKQVKWLLNDRNGGFSYAMNKGLKVAKGDYLAIMNSDCTWRTDLDEMMEFMKSHPEVGAIAPQMRDRNNQIQDTARPYVSLQSFVWRQTVRILMNKVSILTRKMNYSQIQTVDWMIGAFIMVPRQVYQKVGGLDERIFMYAEDLDWCTRIRQHGYEVVYFPKALIIYKGTRRARNDFKYAWIFIQSHLIYWRKFGFFWGYPKRKKIVYKDNQK